MTERRVRNVPSEFEFAGGVLTDAPIGDRIVEDLENLLSPGGGSKGLKARCGISPVIKLVPAVVTTGCVLWLVTLDDVARTKLVACQNASTKKIIHIAHYTDQEGRSEMLPFTGGFDPDDPAADGEGLPVTTPVEPDGTCPPTLRITDSAGVDRAFNEFPVTASLLTAEWPHLLLSAYPAGETSAYAEVFYTTTLKAGAVGSNVTNYTFRQEIDLVPGVPASMKLTASGAIYNALYGSTLHILRMYPSGITILPTPSTNEASAYLSNLRTTSFT